MGIDVAATGAIVDEARGRGRFLVGMLALAALLLLGAKLALLWRVNLNWDEFYFLTHVHSLVRGELAAGLQTAYTHLFRWLPGSGGDEIAQLHVARVLMWLLLGLGAALLLKLAQRWFSLPAAAFAAVAFVAMLPTLLHGAAFRADSMLLPLELAALLALTDPRRAPRRRALAAGAWLGLATAITLKAVLLAPVFVALLLLRRDATPTQDATAASDDGRASGAATRGSASGAARAPLGAALAEGLWLALAAALVAGSLLGLHLATLDPATSAAAPSAAGSAWQRTIAAAEFAPRADTWWRLVSLDPVWWLLATLGAAWCVATRRWAALACALALTPLLFYRNAFAYYYVPMCAPAGVLLAAAWDALAAGLRRIAPARTASLALGALVVAVTARGLLQADYLQGTRQDTQRAVVAAVHRIFPRPVAYLDHSGMIASFRKVNFFMSSWGVAEYQAAGRPFVAAALARFAPPLLLANRGAIVPDGPEFQMLLPEDQRLIARSYLPYWGPVYVAGAAATLQGAEPATLSLPFAGRYRLDSSKDVEVGGRRLAPGETLEVGATQLTVGLRQVEPAAPALEVRLVWAEARPAPPGALPEGHIYDGLLPAG